MASMPRMNVRVTYTVLKPLRYFFARQADEPSPHWVVEEIEVSPKGAKWCSTLYEPVLSRIVPEINRQNKLGIDERLEHVAMDKRQAKKEAKLWNEKELESAKGKRGKR
jgi:hypothetical protein